MNIRKWPMAARLGFASLLIMVSLAPLNLVRYFKLSRDGVEAVAKVVKKDDSRKELRYAFRSGNKLYFATGRAGYGNPDFEHLQLKDDVTAYYLPDDPEVSTLGNPNQLLVNEALMVVGAGLILPAIGFLLYLLRRRQRAKAS